MSINHPTEQTSIITPILTLIIFFFGLIWAIHADWREIRPPENNPYSTEKAMIAGWVVIASKLKSMTPATKDETKVMLNLVKLSCKHTHNFVISIGVSTDGPGLSASSPGMIRPTNEPALRIANRWQSPARLRAWSRTKTNSKMEWTIPGMRKWNHRFEAYILC